MNLLSLEKSFILSPAWDDLPKYLPRIGSYLKDSKTGIKGKCYGVAWNITNWEYLIVSSCQNPSWIPEKDLAIAPSLPVFQPTSRFKIGDKVKADSVIYSLVLGVCFGSNGWEYLVQMKDDRTSWLSEKKLEHYRD